jgi:hypothetical protein
MVSGDSPMCTSKANSFSREFINVLMQILNISFQTNEAAPRMAAHLNLLPQAESAAEPLPPDHQSIKLWPSKPNLPKECAISTHTTLSFPPNPPIPSWETRICQSRRMGRLKSGCRHCSRLSHHRPFISFAGSFTVRFHPRKRAGCLACRDQPPDR